MLKGQNVMILLRISMGIIASYIVMKFLIRPIVLKNGYNELSEIIVLSYPNFCEAIVGTIFISLILLSLNGMLVKNKSKFILRDNQLYLLATIIAGVFVILQELKIHNLGGDNVYDVYDVIFSSVGLITSYAVLLKFKPHIIRIQ